MGTYGCLIISIMKQIPKHNIYKVPEGYFEALPERILRSKKTKARQVFLSRMAAAAVLVIGIAVFIFRPSFNEATLQAEMDQEVEFYINSGIWNAEDVLSFSENPDELLDVIIAEEWASYNFSDDPIPVEELDY